MSIPGKVLVALFAALVAALVSAQLTAGLSVVSIFIPCAAASIAAVVLSHRALPMPGGIASTTDANAPAAAKPARAKKEKKEKKEKKKPAAASDSKPKAKANGKLENGTVKWFNGTKGFGFIIRENGEEIFVHHRSIQGDGRRSLKDGADVRFRVVNTDKGPQAGDVESVA